ncbi:MAG: lysine--tRNA ligase [candidate division Zixibacteria bacterium RBG_16_50_21]|nr:MAG: lysine--tRNA ligase [candidate division Zixibacteria bacterium RBG_16_50_21]
MSEQSELFRIRREKLEKLRQQGLNPYPYCFKRTHFSSGILANFDQLSSSNQTVKIAGRIITLRSHGKSLFFHCLDDKGKIQVYVKSDAVGPEKYALFDLYDLGDFIGVTGTVFKTKTGEITVKVTNFELLSKSLRPLPEKWHGLQDKELRYRQRYVDLFTTPGVKEVFIKRAKTIKAIRDYLDSHDFVEVETPILQPLYGGASARPFVTHHNALDMDLYLRIADELYLKRLLAGGFERVYEFCKDFRNEGMDRNHNPEFTMLELYVAFWDYYEVMNLVEDMLNWVAKAALGSNIISYNEHQIDLTPPWKRVSLLAAIEEKIGVNLLKKTAEEIWEIATNLELNANLVKNRGKLIEAIFEGKVQPFLIAPTFVTDYPVEMSPLAKKHRSNPLLTERFELFIGAGEIANAFSELNDPIDQRQRFEDQMKMRSAGDEEAQVLDEDYLRAMEYGMPPIGGLGIGIDRLVMMLCDQRSIRDVILFPQMKPETDGL